MIALISSAAMRARRWQHRRSGSSAICRADSQPVYRDFKDYFIRIDFRKMGYPVIVWSYRENTGWQLYLFD